MIDTTIHVSNLLSALQDAIERQRLRDAKHGPAYKSALRVGWEANMQALQNGHRLNIIYPPDHGRKT